MATTAPKRGRGRPPKKTAPLPDTLDDVDAHQNGDSAQILPMGAGDKPSTGRGRAPKKTADKPVTQPANGELEPANGELEPANGDLDIPGDGNNVDVVAKKPKINEEEQPVMEPEKSSGNNMQEAPATKGRGRPKKNPQ